MTDRDFEMWRKRARHGLPELAARVFALRGKSFQGYGFGWSTERELGIAIAQLNDYDRTFTEDAKILLEVRLEELNRTVSLAEDEAGVTS